MRIGSEANGWSSDGKYLLVQREATNVSKMIRFELEGGKGARPPMPVTEVIVWSAATGKSSVVLSLPIDEGIVGDLEWLPTTTSLVCSLYSSSTREPSKVLLIKASSGQVKELYRSKPDTQVSLRFEVSPVAPLGIIQEFDPEKGKSSIRPFGVNGLLGQGPIEPGIAGGWGRDGSYQFDELVVRPNGAIEKAKSADFVGYEAAEKEPKLRIQQMPLTSSSTSLPVDAVGLWMASSDKKAPPVCITTDGTMGSMAPDLSAVAYVSKGMAVVRGIVSMPADLFAKAQQAALIASLMSDAKQLALGLILHASDNDDKMLGQGSDWRTAIDPYMKNSGLGQNFVLTFAGGDLSKVESPATTVLGYIDGPGGRAVAYVDGHVKWIKN
ncbi:MAG: hypothetical protein ACOYON_07380 [Fimbriimonas sp.]